VGIYYSFENYSSKWQEWHGILSLRLNATAPLLSEQINIISDKVAYVFFGWKYVVTTDGGISWRKWDAEDHFPKWKYYEPNFIKSIHLLPDGKGTMTLNHVLLPTNYSPVLSTNDYGEHWSINQTQ
jgi:hypothetical protein